MIKLERCPFCGGAAVIGHESRFNSGDMVEIISCGCDSCGVMFEEGGYVGHETEERTKTVVAKWNRRASDMEQGCRLTEEQLEQLAEAGKKGAAAGKGMRRILLNGGIFDPKTYCAEDAPHSLQTETILTPKQQQELWKTCRGGKSEL